MKVGWIGLGKIGKQMALRARRGGHEVVGHARDVCKHADLAKDRVRLSSSATTVAGKSDVVCVSVFDEAQLRDVLLKQEALASMPPGSTLVIHSTVGPTIIRELARTRTDIDILDAPFSGTEVDAAAGKITLMVGGEAAALAAVGDVLRCYADYIQHMGPLGAGATVKLVNNALFGAQALLAHDGLRVLTKTGVAQSDAVRLIERSSGGSYAMRLFGGASEASEVLSGIWPYIKKDVTIARAAAAEAGLELGLLDVSTKAFLEDRSD